MSKFYFYIEKLCIDFYFFYICLLKKKLTDDCEKTTGLETFAAVSFSCALQFIDSTGKQTRKDK